MARKRRHTNHDPLKFCRHTDESDGDQFVSQRGRDVLEKLIDQNPEYAQALSKAHESLALDVNYAAAMHTAARALRAGFVNVFVSYRSSQDLPAARALAAAFRNLSRGHVKLTFADEFSTKISGLDYKEEIAQAIKDAHWFILIASDSTSNTDWCMFETGMFRGAMVSKRINRLICLHHPDAGLPEPIHEFQAIQATGPRLAQFLDGLFRRPEPIPGWEALNPTADPAIIEAAAINIAEAFTPPSTPVRFNYWLSLTAPAEMDLSNWKNLDPAPIKTDALTAHLFGKTVPPATWGELVDTVVRGNSTTKWLVELAAVFEKARRNERFRPVSGTFESGVGGKVMRPIVHSMDTSGAKSKYHLVFVEEISSAPNHKIHPQTLALLTAVRMNSRIRWEIIERFNAARWDVDTIDACAKVFSRIEREFDTFGKWNLDVLCANFNADDQPIVRSIVGRWRKLRTSGTRNGQRIPGELDLAFKDHNPRRVAKLLVECAELNRTFLGVAIPAMNELVSSGRTSAQAPEDGGA